MMDIPSDPYSSSLFLLILPSWISPLNDPTSLRVNQLISLLIASWAFTTSFPDEKCKISWEPKESNSKIESTKCAFCHRRKAMLKSSWPFRLSQRQFRNAFSSGVLDVRSKAALTGLSQMCYLCWIFGIEVKARASHPNTIPFHAILQVLSKPPRILNWSTFHLRARLPLVLLVLSSSSRALQTPRKVTRWRPIFELTFSFPICHRQPTKGLLANRQTTEALNHSRDNKNPQRQPSKIICLAFTWFLCEMLRAKWIA